jgi:HNH endonuclease
MLCYAAWDARRSTPEAKAKLYKRFDAKVETTPYCWEWTGAKTDRRYGSIGVEGKTCYAHRISYEREFGPIPDGFDIDHLCRNRACVNPHHLEAVPRKENLRRGSRVALKTHSAQGHPWAEEHIYVRPGSGKKMCRTCNIERRRARPRTRF